LIAVGALVLPASAQAIDYAPVDQPGPPLSVPQADLDASLQCSTANSVDNASTTPVLLVHGTGSDPEHNFGWNYEPALDDLGVPWCTVALLDNGMADIQVSGEYVVNAIRTMYARAGRKISIFGHSQGGMIPRWPLRFWPDTRAMVDDVVGFAPSNHGTEDSRFTCSGPDGCPPAHWQQASNAQFIQAANSFQETFAGISYTVAYTHTDWVVTPNQDAETGSSSLRTGDGQISNVAIQDICPADLNEHLAIGTSDPVAYALAIDALQHPGPADPSRIESTVCQQAFMPGVNPATYPTDAGEATLALAQVTATYPHVASEPPLKCYVFAGGCPSSAAAATAAVTVRHKKCKSKKSHSAKVRKKGACKKKHKRGKKHG
jgi:pimeloyl-ACP methyl ester carboxylesterase